MKIVFITYHNWKTLRMGGFHKFAEASARAGNEVVFFSFPRPYYIFFKHEERLNAEVLKSLSKGVTYSLDSGHSILNVTWPTLSLPGVVQRFIPKGIKRWFSMHSIIPFRHFDNKNLKNADVFVFESCEGVFLFDRIKKMHPDARFVYRPSDPLMIDGAAEEKKMAEREVLLNSDMSLIVNNLGVDLYKRNIPRFNECVNYLVLPNGVDSGAFKIKYPCPELLRGRKTALYVGARCPEWELLPFSANRCPDVLFVIICPETVPPFIKDCCPDNIVFIPGVSPDEVPKWITNTDVVIVPNPQGRYKVKPWGITAKYYQAMAAGKKIVAYEDDDKLVQFGITVTHTYEEFAEALKQAFVGEMTVYYDYCGKEWSEITDTFLGLIQSLVI